MWNRWSLGKTKKTLHGTEDGGPTRQKKEAPTDRGGPPGDAGEHAQGTNYVKTEPRSHRSHGGRAHKRQKTQHMNSYYDQPATGSSAMHSTPNTNTQGQKMQPTPALSVTEFDVKPDMKVFPGCGTGVKKGGKRLFIEEYSH
jgi:hypothetical protein